MRSSTYLLAAAGAVALIGAGVALALPKTPAPAPAPEAVLAATAPASEGVPAVGAPIPITVYHSPTCGCCKEWVKHMEANGFSARIIEQADLAPIKAELGVASRLRSCHTAVVGGYVIEGHVPAGDVKRLLAEKPKVVGLSIPGMPQSAPGMNQGSEPYEVLSWDANGQTASWAKHN